MASMLLHYKYLSKVQIAGFDKYKYKSIDTSPLSNYIMHPFWDQLVKIFPLWLAANTITLVGWCISLFGYILCSYYDFHLDSSKTVPSWVWLVSGLCIFGSHQLDGCDGKQARRTNSGSPLGEMFDHGLDSSTVMLICVSFFSLIGVSDDTVYQWEATAVYMAVLFAFYVAHWEKYNTSVMFLPWAYDFSQIILAGSFILSYFHGTEIWRTPYFFNGTTNISFLFKITCYVCVGCLVVPMSLYNQYQARVKNPKDCVGVTEGVYPLVALLLPTTFYLLFGALSRDNIVVTQLRLYLAAYGILYSNINCRLIVAQMTSTKCDRFNVLAWPIFPMIAASYAQLISDRTLLLSYVIFLILAHLHYGVNVVHQLCDHLHIYAFRISRPKVGHKNDVRCTNGLANGKMD